MPWLGCSREGCENAANGTLLAEGQVVCETCHREYVGKDYPEGFLKSPKPVQKGVPLELRTFKEARQ